MKILKGDLIQYALNGHFDVIVHGCNCFNTMSAGIARQIRHAFPEAFEADKRTAYGDKNKLGSISTAYVTRNNRQLCIVNAYTQYDYGNTPGKVYVRYDALLNCFAKIRSMSIGLRVGYPLIGCGLAHGDWKIISAIINGQLEGIHHTVVLYDKTKR